MSPKPPAIGVFDSGFGGLTVLRELARQIAYADFHYYADSGRNPYGTRPEEEIARFSIEILDFLATKGIDLAVIACNTATVAALHLVEHAYSFPVLGVVGAGARGAAKATINRHIGVIATPFTIAKKAYEHAILAMVPDAHVVGVPSPRMVRLVEDGLIDGEEARQVVREDLMPLSVTDIDTLVLGCTHFPLLSPHIKAALPGRTLVDPAREVTLEAQTLISSATPLAQPRKRFYTSGDPASFARLGSIFLGEAVVGVERVAF